MGRYRGAPVWGSTPKQGDTIYCADDNAQKGGAVPQGLGYDARKRLDNGPGRHSLHWALGVTECVIEQQHQ